MGKRDLDVDIADTLRDGTPDEVALMLDDGIDPNGPVMPKRGHLMPFGVADSVITFAAKASPVASMEVILDRGGDPFSLGKTESASIHSALSARRWDMARFLLDRHPGLATLKTGPNVGTLTTIHNAVANDHTPIDILDRLEELGCSPADTDSLGKDGLIYAAMNGNLAATNWFLAKGLSPKTESDDGITAIRVASFAKCGEACLLRFIEEGWAKNHRETMNFAMNSMVTGHSPAALDGFMEHGVGINEVDGHGRSFLSEIIRGGSGARNGQPIKDRVVHALEKGADPNLTHKNAKMTPVELARNLRESGLADLMQSWADERLMLPHDPGLVKAEMTRISP